MTNSEKLYNEILQERPWMKQISWQKEFLLRDDLLNSAKLVLGAGTSSGKTLTELIKLEMFYRTKGNKGKRSLVIPASMTNLKENFRENIEDFNPSFSYCIVDEPQELRDAITQQCDVIIALPMTVKNNLKDLPHFHNFVLDEAHEWYFADTIKDILKKIKPVHQTLLTGTPFEFTRKAEKDGFTMYYVPVMDLYDEGLITNVQIEVVSSAYNYKSTDYNNDHALTRDAIALNTKDSKKAFRKVCLGMIKKLRNPIKELQNVNRLTNEVGGLLFKHLDKTVIWANSVEQANLFEQVLNKFKGLEGAVVVSHYKNDPKSQYMQDFKEQDHLRVLVAVARGRLGWSYTELFNCVDFTMTRNLSTTLQMLARLFRVSKHKPNKKKIYYKVANAKDAGYYVKVMECVLVLLGREWYEKFNGKNMYEIPIPRVVTPKVPSTEPKAPVKKRQTAHSLYDLGVPLDLNFFRDNIYNKQSDYFSTIAMTTLGTVRRMILGIVDKITPDYAKHVAKQYKTRHELLKDRHSIATWIQDSGLQDECYSHMKDWYYESNQNNKEVILEYFKSKADQIHLIQDIDKIPSEVYAHIPTNKKYSGGWFKTKAKELGIFAEVRKMVGLRPKSVKHNKANTIKLAKKYKTQAQFEKANVGALMHAKRNGYHSELKPLWKSKERTVKELTTGLTGTYKELADKFTKITGNKINDFTLAAQAKRGKLITHKNSLLRGYQFTLIN